MKIGVMLAMLFICSLSCQKEEGSQPLTQAPYQKWQSFNLHDYTIDQIRSCFCPHAGELVRITVRHDTVAQVTRLSDTTAVTYPFYRSIDSLFAIILNPGGDSLVVRYNDQYGYPEFLDVNPQSHPVDGGYLFETSNLQVR
jgi:hypothetical protein